MHPFYILILCMLSSIVGMFVGLALSSAIARDCENRNKKLMRENMKLIAELNKTS